MVIGRYIPSKFEKITSYEAKAFTISSDFEDETTDPKKKIFLHTYVRYPAGLHTMQMIDFWKKKVSN